MLEKSRSKIKMFFLTMDGFPMGCLSSAIEPLRVTNEIIGYELFEWSLVSENQVPTKSSAKVSFDNDLDLEKISDGDFLFILSAPTSKFKNPGRANATIRRLFKSGIAIGAFSGGIFPLAKSGIMEGIQCSVHWCYEHVFRSQFLNVRHSNSVIAVDKNRYTASGAGAVFDLMLTIIEKELGSVLMTEVACWFQHPYIRTSEITQRKPLQDTDETTHSLPKQVQNAIKVFSENIEITLQVSDVAKNIGISPRHLERLFQKFTSQSPLQYYRNVRLNHARHLVLNTNNSLISIAMDTGFSSSSALHLHYKRKYGSAPTKDRQRQNEFRVTQNLAVPSAI